MHLLPDSPVIEAASVIFTQQYRRISVRLQPYRMTSYIVGDETRKGTDWYRYSSDHESKGLILHGCGCSRVSTIVPTEYYEPTANKTAALNGTLEGISALGFYHDSTQGHRSAMSRTAISNKSRGCDRLVINRIREWTSQKTLSCALIVLTVKSIGDTLHVLDNILLLQLSVINAQNVFRLRRLRNRGYSCKLI